MAKVSVTHKIGAPQEKVFDIFTDLERAKDRIGAIMNLEILTEGPVGKGTRFRETRMMFKKEHTEEMEITEFQRPDGYTVGASGCGCEYRTSFRFHPDGDATRVEMEFEARPLTWVAKLMTPLSWLMMGSLRKCMEKDIEDLKKVAESAEATA